MDAVLHSSARHDWQTPDEILELVRKLGPIALDPCTAQDNPTSADKFFCWDGLSAHWEPLLPCDAAAGLAYVNPPYGSELKHWVGKCCDEGGLGCPIVLLCPNRPDTKWFDRASCSANAICEIRGRLRFKGAPHPAPFPSAIFYWGPSPHLFCHVFQERGRVRVLRS